MIKFIQLIIVLSLGINTVSQAAEVLTSEQLTKAEQTFLTSAAMCAMFQMQMAELAKQNGESPKIKEFGRAIAELQETSNKKIKEIADVGKIELPTVLNQGLQDVAAKFSRLKGLKFDREFLSYMLDYQDAYIRIFEQEKETGRHSPSKALATEMVTAIQAQIDLILALQSELKVMPD